MKTNSKKVQAGVKVSVAIKAGGFGGNHNRALLSVKSGLKAGAGINHANHTRRLA